MLVNSMYLWLHKGLISITNQIVNCHIFRSMGRIQLFMLWFCITSVCTILLHLIITACTKTKGINSFLFFNIHTCNIISRRWISYRGNPFSIHVALQFSFCITIARSIQIYTLKLGHKLLRMSCFQLIIAYNILCIFKGDENWSKNGDLINLQAVHLIRFAHFVYTLQVKQFW